MTTRLARPPAATSTFRERLHSLATDVESLGVSRTLDREIMLAFAPESKAKAAPRITASLDRIWRLMPEGWRIHSMLEYEPPAVSRRFRLVLASGDPMVLVDARSDTFHGALLAAILRAHSYYG